MRGTGLEGAVGVGDGATGIVVEVGLDVAADDTAESADEVIDLAGAGAADSVGDTNAVDANLVDGAVDGEEVDQVGAERVLGGEADLLALALDKLNDLQSSVLDAMGKSVLSVAS